MSVLNRLKDRWELAFPAARARTNGHETKGASGVSLRLSPGIEFFGHPGTGEITRFFGGHATGETERVTVDTAYAASVYAFAAIRYRAKVRSQPPLIVSEETDDTDEWVQDHPLADLLDTPSPDYDMGELLHRTSCYLDITGSALWLKQPDGVGRVGGLTPYSGHEFKVESSRERIRGLYRISTQSGEITAGPDEVVYFHEPHPHDWHRGLSLLEVALAWLNLGQHARAIVAAMLGNGVFPPVIVQTDKDWRPNADSPEWREFKAALRAYATTRRKGEPLALTGGGSATVIAQSLKDLIPGDILNRVESVVSSVFGVPAVVLQWEVGLQNAPWSQMKEARRMFYEDTVEPDLWAPVEKALTRQLLWAPTREGGQPIELDRNRTVRFDTSDVRALQPDRQADAELQDKLRDIASKNERRVIVGLEPSEDPEYAELPKRQPPPLGLFGAAPAPGDQDSRASFQHKDAGELVKHLTWYNFDLATKQQEPAWITEVAELLDGQKARVLRLFEEIVTDPADALQVTEFMQRARGFLTVEQREALQSAVRPLVSRTAAVAVERLGTQLGVSFGSPALRQALADYVQREAVFLADVMGETTGKAVARVMGEAMAEGQNIGQMTRALRDLPEFDRDRARLVARTETTRVTNGAQVEQMRGYEAESGRAVWKMWLSARDDRVRDEHVDLDGEQVPVAEEFSNGLQGPGEPNCRCTLVYTVAQALPDAA